MADGPRDPKQLYLTDGLHYALATDRKSLLESLIQLGADPNERNRITEDLPLTVASSLQNCGLFEKLLELGADGQTFLSTFCPPTDVVRFFVTNLSSFKLLVESGVKVDTAC
jgi:ankyrin repeat protein